MNNTEKPPLGERLTISCIVIILSIFGLCGHGIVCTIFIKFKNFNSNFKNPFYRLALALSFCDIYYLVVDIFLNYVPVILSNGENVYPDYVHNDMNDVSSWNTYSMYALIVIISVNRFISIAYYERYAEICTKIR